MSPSALYAGNAQVVPEGEPQQYELSALYMGQEAVKLTRMAMQVSWNRDSTKVYFCDLFIYYRTAGTGIWTEGTAVKNADGTRSITIPLQYVNEYRSDAGVSHLYVGGATDATVTALGEYRMTMKADGTFVPVDASQYLVYAQIEKNSATGEMEIAARCAYHNQMTLTPAEGDLTLVTPPVSAVQWDYSYSYKDSDGKAQIASGKVAVDGKTVYFNRLCPNYNAWVRGYADENIQGCTGSCTIHVPTSQYLGNTSFYNMFLKAAHENETKEGEYSTYTLTDEVTLTYSATDASFTLTDKDLCIEGLYSGNVSAVNYGFNIRKVNSEAHTNPTDPYDLMALDGMEYEDTPYCVMYYIDNKGENGDLLDTEKLFYRIYINNHAVEFDSSTFDDGIAEGTSTTTLVPYSYSGGNFGGSASRHWWYFGEHLCSTIGIQQVYIADGQEYTSRIVNINFMDPAQEKDDDAKEVAATGKSVYVGYSDGNIASEATGKVGGNHAAGTYECYIKLTKKNLQKYVGSSIKAVRIGMPEAERYPELKVWVRSTPDGVNLAEGTVSAPVTGWNTCYLNTDVEISDDQLSALGSELYIGYTYSQTARMDIVSLAGTTSVKGCYVAEVGGDTWNYACRGWGSLAIEAEIFGDQAITNDIRLTALQPSVKMVKKGEKLVLKGTVKNMGITALTGYSVEYKVGKRSSVEYVNRAVDVREVDSFQIAYNIPSPQVENNIPVEVTIGLLGGLTDDMPANNQGSTTFSIYDETLPRNVLIEEFTTEQCGWCPSGAWRIHKALEELNSQPSTLNSQLYWACHHVGFGTDWLTLSDSEMYLHLYNSEETFAPAWSLNRNTAYVDEDKPGTVYSIPASVDLVKADLEKAMQEPAFVSVDATGKIVDDVAEITVNLTRNESLFGQCANPLLTVYVVEDSIAVKSQKNYAAQQYPMTHHTNVMRAVLTPVWGQSIVWDENQSSAAFRYNVPQGYDRSHLKVIAFVHDYSATDVSALKVLNVGGCRISSEASGISEMKSEDVRVGNSGIFNLAGQRVKNARHGIYIIDGKPVITH